jgi:carboxyl-terminal processing protease
MTLAMPAVNSPPLFRPFVISAIFKRIPNSINFSFMLRQATIILLCFILMSSSNAQTNFQKDFDFYWKSVDENFAYFHRQKANWEKVRQIYQPFLDTINNNKDFISLLEKVNNELYNGHVFLNTNTPASNRLIPSGADLKVEWRTEKFVVTELRQGYNAEQSGITVGTELVRFNSVPVPDAVKQFLPRSVLKPEKAMYEYAANMLLAGTHDTRRVITARVNGKERDFYPDANGNKTEVNEISLLEGKMLQGNIGYIKINNSLGNLDLIQAFDHKLDSLMNTNALILDLRETGSGGTSTVARAIMGRFVTKEQPYQKHIYTAEEMETGIRRSTLELVSPRKKIYNKPMVVLVGYWTGSMGEGMAVAFDGMHRARVAGTAMAGLLGEIYTFTMPETGISFSFPCVQLQHINGLPREDFIPPILVKDQRQAIEKAIEMLSKKNRTGRDR